MKPQSRITQLRYKRQAGQPLTQEERQELAGYHARYARAKQSIHLSDALKAEWMRRAQEQGISLGAWVKQRVAESLVGYELAVGDLKKEVERLQGDLTGMRGVSGTLAAENANLQRRLESQETDLRDILRELREMRMEAKR